LLDRVASSLFKGRRLPIDPYTDPMATGKFTSQQQGATLEVALNRDTEMVSMRPEGRLILQGIWEFTTTNLLDRLKDRKDFQKSTRLSLLGCIPLSGNSRAVGSIGRMALEEKGMKSLRSFAALIAALPTYPL